MLISSKAFNEHLAFNVVRFLKCVRMNYQNYIYKKVSFNISDTYVDMSMNNRAITRNKLVFSGSSLFDVQFLYPLFSELTYPTAVFRTYSSSSR